MLIRITGGVLRGSWWSLVVILSVIAVYLLLGRAFVYTAAGNKDRIETLLHDSGLQYVTLGEVRGDWRVFDPVFELSDVVLEREGEKAVVVDRLRLRLNSFRSLLGRTAVISEMVVTGLSLTLVIDDEGVRIRGLSGGDRKFNADPILDSIPHLNVIELNDIDIGLLGRDYQLQMVSRRDQPWVIAGSGDRKQLSLPLYLERELEDGSLRENSLSLTGYYQGDMRQSDFSADLYLEASGIELVNYLPRIDVLNKRVSSATLDTEIWLKITPDEVDAAGHLVLSDVGMTGEEGELELISEVSTLFRYQGDSFSEGQLHIPRLSISQNDYRLELDHISLATSVSAGSRSFAGEVPHIDVTELVDLLHFAGEKSLVPTRLGEALYAVGPRGSLRDVSFSLNLVDGIPELAGKLDGFAMDAYLGVPAIDHLNGFIYLQPERGYLDIDNDAFVMNFANMFSEPWPFDSGRGRLAYELADGQFRVTSGLIELKTDGLEAYGKLMLNLPGDRELQTWGLTVGIENGELLTAARYLPNTLSDGLRTWFDDAVHGGTAVEAGLIFHGALFRGAPKLRKSHDLYFKVDESRLSYQPEWPVIENVTGTVHIDNYLVRADDVVGQVYDTGITAASVKVPMNAAGRANTVLIDAAGEGPFPDVIRALNETPLAETTANVAAQWQSEGAMQAGIKLDIPVGDRTGEEVSADVDVSFTGSTLVMPEFDLTVEEIDGSARYSTSAGLSSDGFTGVMFDQPISGTISTKLQGEGGEIEVGVGGTISADALYEWADQVLLSRLDGDIGYETVVHVPYGGKRDAAYVIATSDLRGATMDLPFPLDKADPDTTRQFVYSQYFQDRGYRVDLTLDDTIKASLKIEDGIALGGRVHFGSDPNGTVAYDQIRMTGHLEHLNYEAWMQATDALGELTDVTLEDEIAEHVESAVLSIDELMLYSLPLEAAQVRVTRGDKAWLAGIVNEMMEGDVRVHDDGQLPIDIRLRHLSFEEDEGDADPLAEVSPLEIGDVDFMTEKLIIGEKDYGSWSFNFRTSGEVARFENLQANVAGLVVLPGSVLEWERSDEGHITRYAGDVKVDDLAHALETFGLASSIEGRGLKLAADVSWQGSPAMVDVARVGGNVTIHEGKGRFVQAETGGALKLLGIFDFASLARRFRLDFSDVVNKGFEFSDISGVTSFNEGVVGVTDPIVIEGSSGRFTVGGSIDLNTGMLDNEMIVTLPVGRTLPWYAAYSAIATGPLAGAGVMIAQKVFESQIDQMSSAKYRITGSIDEPDIEFIAIFDDKVAEVSPAEPQ